MIVLLRHTRPDISPDICYGVSDLQLHEDFDTHFCDVTERLNGYRFDKIYSSPLFRCRTLADRLSAQWQVETIEDGRLREMNFGVWEMRTWHEIYKSVEGKAWFDNYLTACCPDGESFEDVVTRANAFFAEVQDETTNLLVVTHAGFIRAAMVVFHLARRAQVFDIEVSYGEAIHIKS